MKSLLGALDASSPCAICARTGQRAFSSAARLNRTANVVRRQPVGDHHVQVVRRALGGAEDASRPRRVDHGRAFSPMGRRGDKYDTFQRLIELRFHQLVRAMGPWTPANSEWKMFGIHSQSEADKESKLFRAAVQNSFSLASVRGFVGRSDNPLFWKLRNAFVRGDTAALTKELRFTFHSFVLRSRYSRSATAAHQRLADFRFPYEWYPATRTMQRTVHLHVGPTNSGKTYRALQALENARSGIYAGPLRLLAHEIYSRFQAKGKPCALITGEEQRIPEGDVLPYRSCTVEMTPLNQQVDVAVIDEIQMLADEERGWAWTQAFLGVQAREVHLCGEERTVELIESLCARIGDKCIVHRYQRLSSLQTMEASLKGDFGNLQKGDAVVSFSRVGLHALKAGIESATGRRCAIVYGSLPPETRAQQAALFNNPDNDYDFLVASDAIGMGLNLEIKRVIFEAVAKRSHGGFRTLTVPEVKQIGGRAGRYRTAAQDIKTSQAAPQSRPAATKPKWGGTPGFVSTMEEQDLGVVQDAFSVDAEPIKSAGIQPPTFAIEKFSTYFPPETPLSFVLLRLRDFAKVSHRFHLCHMDDAIDVADIIQPYPMSVFDRCVFLSAPVSLRDLGQKQALQAFAQCVSEMRDGNLLDIPEIDLEILDVARDDPAVPKGEYLRRLEALHKTVTLYLWLTYRYVGVFTSQPLAFHVKQLVEDKITDYLEHLSYVPEQRSQRMQQIRRLVEKQQKREKAVSGGKKQEDAAGTHEGVGQWNEEGHEEPLVQDETEAALVDVQTPAHRIANDVLVDGEGPGPAVEETRV